jgi:hypothetical protein
MEEHRLRIFENTALRKICLHKTKEITWEWRKWYSVGLLNEMGRSCAMYVVERRCWGSLKKKDHLEDLGMDGRIALKLFLKMGLEGVY